MGYGVCVTLVTAKKQNSWYESAHTHARKNTFSQHGQPKPTPHPIIQIHSSTLPNSIPKDIQQGNNQQRIKTQYQNQYSFTPV